MLNQQRSGNWARLRSLLTVSICIGLLSNPILVFSKTYGWVDIMIVKDLAKQPEQSPDTLPRNAYMVRFINDLGANVRYPEEAVSNKFEGHVIATFTVANNKLQNIKIIISGKGYGIPEEVTKALQNSLQPVNISPGKYAVPFYFSLARFNRPHTRDEDAKINEFKGIANGFILLKEVVIGYP